MSFVTRRALSTLIPPKVASPKGLSAAPNAGKIKMWVDFYARLPKGPAPEFKPKGLWQRYQHKYFDGDNASAAPIWHVIFGLMAFGYAQNYYFHLRHIKHNAH